MLTRDDLVDLIIRHLAAAGPAAIKEKGRRPPMLPKGRLFLSERELKQRLTPQAEHLIIPKGAILSPLATDWLVLKGIKIIRE